jgi:hypothetical protein
MPYFVSRILMFLLRLRASKGGSDPGLSGPLSGPDRVNEKAIKFRNVSTCKPKYKQNESKTVLCGPKLK